MLASFLSGQFLLHIPCWHFILFLLGEFLLHIPCWLHFCLGCFSYTSHADFLFLWGVSLTHPVLPSFLCREFILHILCCLDFYAGSFSYTSHAAFKKKNGRGVSLTHPMLFFLFYQGSFSGFIFIWGVSLTHPVLASFLAGEFLSHIPC